MRANPLVDTTSIVVLRFLIMWGTLELAGLLGVPGWWKGLVVNVVITAVAVAIVSRRRLWRSTGLLTAWRSRAALLCLVPLAAEGVSWLVPSGIIDRGPGAGWWAVSLLLVGMNEEMFSRGIVLSRLAEAYRPRRAVAITATLFGLQHLSALVLTSRTVDDVLLNVLASGCYGFALAAYQLRFAWLWTLVLVHGFADWTTILSAAPHSDVVVAVLSAGFVAYGFWLLRGSSVAGASSSRSAEGALRLIRRTPTGATFLNRPEQAI